jgi:aspartate-semialdehyde dehydrogenase
MEQSIPVFSIVTSEGVKMKVNVAVVGATGAVGQAMCRILEERKFPVGGIRFLASERSAGKTVRFRRKKYPVQQLRDDSFEGVDIALFSIPKKLSRRYAQIAVDSDCIVVDNSNAFRMEEWVPLVVPEVNAQDIRKHKGIIANPNCSTIQMVVALAPIHKAARIKRVVVTTFQSVSGVGLKAMDELLTQTRQVLAGKKAKAKIMPHQIAFNCIPQIPNSASGFLDNAYTEEEMKMTFETQKIMGDGSIKVTATTVRVPVMVGHSESVNIETKKKLTASRAMRILRKAPGVSVIDEPAKMRYPLPLAAEGKDEVFVGRIRQDDTIKNGLNMWIVSDNLRKGAALNAIQIAEHLLKYYRKRFSK